MKKTKKYLIITLFLLSIHTMYSQGYKTTTYQSYTKARHIFDKLIKNNKYNLIDSLSFKLSGTWYYLGHYSLPEKRQAAEVIEKINQYGKENRILKLEGEVTLEGDKYHKSFYYSNDSLSLVDYGEHIPITNVIDIRDNSDIIMLSPITLVRDIHKRIHTLRFVGFNEKDSCNVLTYSSSLGKQISFYVKNKDFTLLKSELLDYGALHGDYIKEYSYQDYKTVKNFFVPSKLIIKEWGVIKKELNYTYSSITDKSLLYSCKNYELKKVDNNFYTIVLPTKQNRVFVLDFGNYLGIVEAPLNNKYSYCVYQILKNNFPEKKIKYLFLSHHHPDHAGGFYYYLKKGVTIFTTKRNEKYFQKLAARNHSIKSNLFSSLNNEGKFEVIPSRGMKKIASNEQSIVMYEFGKETLHAEEYLLFYLPRLKTVILGDLWRVPLKGVYGSKRAVNLGKFIQQHKLKVDKIYQSWPLKNVKEFASFDELQESIKLYQKK